MASSLRVFNPFAVRFANITPYNPNLKYGIPAIYNPSLAVAQNKPLLDVIQKSVDYFYKPAEQRAYLASTIPQRIQENKTIGETLSALNDRGLLDSSLAQSVVPLTTMGTQQAVNQATDQIRINYAQAIEAERQKRIQDELNKLSPFMQSLLNQRVYQS
jgi:hypothetical protein